MKKQIVTSLFSLVFLFTCCINCFAQNTDSTAIYDSSDITIEDNFYPVTGDTVLRKSTFQPANDSISAYRSGKDFAYMQNIDSLLKQTKSLTVDTINADNIKNQKKKVRSRRKLGSGDSIFDTLFARALFWTLAICFIVFILYNLFLTEGIFKRSPRQHIPPSARQPEENMLNPGAYEGLIAEALIYKDFRLAVRYLYLQTLQKLTMAGFIHFTSDKTNYEYVKELSGKPHQNEFASLTLHYEYVWYGKFDIDQKIFVRLQKDFKQYHQKL